jgi:hypothetical protein
VGKNFAYLQRDGGNVAMIGNRCGLNSEIELVLAMAIFCTPGKSLLAFFQFSISADRCPYATRIVAFSTALIGNLVRQWTTARTNHITRW